MKNKSVEAIYFQDRQEWRQWLQQNHAKKESVWLIYYKAKSAMPTLSWDEAVDEALCFGWIDSKKKSLDDEKYMQYFSKRKVGGTWSKVNKARIARLIESGLMTKAGLSSIEVAKADGSWSILDDVERHIIPEDLDVELEKRPGARSYFLSLSKSDRRSILQWLVLAKRPETRLKRLQKIAELAAQKLKPTQFR